MLLIITGWLSCAFVAAGIQFAYYQGRWPTLAERGWRGDLGFAICTSIIGGPVWLFIVFLYSGFAEHGWRIVPAHRQSGKYDY